MSTDPKRYQVFVSSTYVDLVEERRAVIQALLELDCIPAGMEMFPAADEDQWSLIKGVIDSSDYYVVIVGGRYGSVSAEGVSFTEMEYDYAISRGIPVLGFVHANPDEIPVGKSDLDQGAREKLDAFRAKVMQKMVKSYATPDDLASVVSRGLIKAMRQYERPGWVRGDQAMTAAVRLEIAELRRALAEAEREQITRESQGSGAIDASFAHGMEQVELTFTVKEGSYVSRFTEDVELVYAWDEVIELLGPSMLDEASEEALRAALCDDAWRHLLRDDPQLQRLSVPVVTIANDSWGKVLVQLRALGVIAVGVKKRTVSDKSVYWRLTDAGDAYLVRLKAVAAGE